jgi:hypothetical protein
MPTKAKKQKKAVKKSPPRRQASLPGMEDRAIAELEKLAEHYANIRDKRMVLTKQEVELNDDLLALMKKHDKTEYHHQDVHCWIKAKDERVKVKIGEIEIKQSKSKNGEDEEDEEEPEETPEEMPEQEMPEAVVEPDAVP